MFTTDYAQKLTDAGGPAIAIPDEDAILDFTRRVAHGSERKHAPLATFLAGWYVGAQVAAGVDAQVAWEAAARLGDGLLED
ncbi:MAG: hypothetical protein HKN80_09500 [Acidimicrobiia bacterium]|nr:hypothetical protein [Acidimicrobiia bacterium]